MEKNKKLLKISFILNILIILFTLFATIVMFTGWKFMGGKDILVVSKIGMFKFFTVDSNLFMGIVALIIAIYQIQILTGKKSEIPKILYIFNLMATVSVAVTFFTVFCYLGFIVEGGLWVLLTNSNLFFHFLTPIFAMVNFILFIKCDELKLKDTLFSILPTFVYSIFYSINVFIHIENGKVAPEYDWYWFVQGGLWQIVIVIPLMFGATYGIGVLLWKLNKIKFKKGKIYENNF